MARATKQTKAAGGAKANGASTNLENVAKIVKAAGEDGVAVKDIATQAGLTVDSARKAVKALVDEGKAKRDGQKIVSLERSGRRSTEVVERDGKILELARAAGAEGATLKDLAESAGVTERLTYESIWRLRKEGKIAREGSTRAARWVATA